MIDLNETNFVVCEDHEGNLIIKKVAEVIFTGTAYTNALCIGRYHVDIVKDEDGLTYTNIYTPGMYYNDGDYIEELQESKCDFTNAKVISEKELLAFINSKFKEVDETIDKCERQKAVLRNAFSEYIK